MGIAERYKFYQRTQGSGECVSDYMVGLRKLASRCKFEAFLTEALRDRLVCGLNIEAIQKALLAKKDLTLQSALDTALSMETVAKKAKEMKDKSGQANNTVHKLYSRQRFRPRGSSTTVNAHSGPFKPCKHCGRKNHFPGDCKFKQATCHNFGNTGHIAPVCTDCTTKKATNSK